MRNKWFRRIRWFIELFTPGFTGYTKSGFEFHVSSNGSITTPKSERKKRLLKMVDDVDRAMARVRELRSSQK
jgi:hypothetical protein